MSREYTGRLDRNHFNDFCGGIWMPSEKHQPLDSGAWSRVYAFLMAQEYPESKSAIQIGEAAQRAALSIDAIRFYERRALLPKAPRTAGRFRLYTADDIARLSFIRQMQGLGFSLREVKQLLELRGEPRDACHEVRDLLKVKLDEVKNKIQKLEKLAHELSLDLRKCDRELQHRHGHAARVCPVLSDSKETKRKTP